MDDLKKLLVDIGLTDSEAKTYLSLLSFEHQTVGPIAKKAGVAYSKVHLLLDKLIEKGLANYIVKDNTRRYSASNPKKILDYLNKKKKQIDGEILSASAILPFLEKKLGRGLNSERFEVYEGLEGLSTIYNEGIDEFSNGEEVLVLGANFGKTTGGEGIKHFFSKINKKRVQKKIKYRLIGNESARNSREVLEWKKISGTQIRFLLEGTPGSINIAADRVMIIYWNAEKPKVFFIKSKPVADSFKQYFEVIWKQAKE